MAFKFKKITKATAWPNQNKPKIEATQEEPLSGYFHDIPAKRDEEFFCREAEKLPSVQVVEFRKALGAPKGMPGWLELDALVKTYNGFRAFEIDDMSFVHLGSKEGAETKVKDLRRIAGLKMKGIQVREIEHLDAGKLTTREQARQMLKRLML